SASIKFNKLCFTGPIDEYFGGVLGKLPYRSLQFDLQTVQSPNLVMKAGQVNFPTPASEHRYTRVTEFRHITGQERINATTVAYEYPEAYTPKWNEPYYPIPREENRIVYQGYAGMAKKLKSVIFAGRLADYKYYNMDQALHRALTCFEKQIVYGEV